MQWIIIIYSISSISTKLAVEFKFQVFISFYLYIIIIITGKQILLVTIDLEFWVGIVNVKLPALYIHYAYIRIRLIVCIFLSRLTKHRIPSGISSGPRGPRFTQGYHGLTLMHRFI